MHTDRRTRSHSLWADLDALVLEEVAALSGRAERQPPSPFASEDAFVAVAVDYLRDRDDPMRLIEQLTAELGFNTADEGDMPDEDFEAPELEALPPEAASSKPATAPDATPDPDPAP